MTMELEEDYEFQGTPPWDPVTRAHFWVIIAVYRFGGNPDVDTPLNETTIAQAAGPGCYYCDLQWNPERTNTLCPGDLAG